MKTSIVLATYNGEKYLIEQLNSFLSQTILPDELVISDDNSNDSTDFILDDFIKNAPFKVIKVKNPDKGYNSNFENGFKYVTGDIIFISDQDDVWKENKIEVVLNYFRNNSKCHVLIHDLEYCDEKLNSIKQTKIQRIKSFNPSLEGYVTGMATAMSKKFLDICLPLPKFINYDIWIHYLANYLKVKFVCCESLAFYRRHQSNATIEGSLNVSKKTKGFDYLKSNFFSSAIPTLEYQTSMLNSVKNKFVIYLDSPIESLFNFRDRIQESEYKLDMIKKRIEIINKPPFLRFFRVAYFFFQGNYSVFSGYRSALRDLFTKMRIYQHK